MRRMLMGAALVTCALVWPAAASAAEKTCATHYLLCINEATQGGERESTWEEMKCGWEYVGCLKRQATEA